MRARRIDTLANRNGKRLPNHGAKWKKALAWAVAAWTLGMAPEAFAHPILDAAGAGVNVSGTTAMTITSEATNNLIKWVDFSIAKNESVNFNDAHNYLNYVTGSAVSDIQGTLTGGAGGHIYLVNPNGILIGDGATVNVGNLHLSTKDLTGNLPTSFADGMSKLTNASIGGDVLNLGTLKATSITVEGNNITFKNVADVKDFAGSAVNTNVTLTAKSGGEIHLGFANETEATAVNDTEYKTVHEPALTGWTPSGTTVKYMLVRNKYELQNMRNNLAGNYMLAGDIDMSGFGNFTPIGYDYSNQFGGNFDGLNYKIKKLTITRSGTNFVGLFGYSEGRIENVGMVDGSITGGNWVGGIVGYNNYGRVKNVYNTGTVSTVSGTSCVGGIVGYNIGGSLSNSGTVTNAYNTGTVSGTGNIVGGIAGSNSGTVTNAYNTGKISGGVGVGGIVGAHDDANKVENAYNTGAVSGTSQIGGIAGYHSSPYGPITNVYNSGTVKGNTVTATAIFGSDDTYVGGIVGKAESTDKVTYAYTSNLSNLTTKDTFTGFDFTENGAWRIYEGKTMPLLTAFLTRKDKISETPYNGSVDVGAVTYRTTTYSGAEAQNGFNYIKDACIVTPRDLTVSFGDISKPYDGNTSATAGTATLNGIVNSDAVSLAEGVTATYDNKNAGTNKTVNYSNLALTGDKAKNYNLANATATGKGTITAKTITATFADVSKTYDGTTSVTAGAGTLTGVVGGDTVNVTGTANFENKNVGTGKTVSYTGVSLGGADAGNYKLAAATAEGKGTINKAGVTISTDAVTKTYDGTTSATGTAKVADGQLFGTDTISGGIFAFADKNAGTGKAITVSNVTVNDGNGGNNYIVTYQNGTGEITAKLLTATFADISKTYNGTTTATAGEGTLTGLIAADEDKVSVSATAAYDTKNVGTGKTVNYTGVTLTGEEKDNYTIDDTATGSGTIEKANVTFTVEDYSREYDGTDSTTGAALKKVGTIYEGDTVSGGTFTLDSRNAGTRTISVSGVAIDDGNGGNNYNVTFQDGTGTITAAPVTFTVKEGFTRVYDGTTDTTGATLKTVGTLYDNISGGTFTLDSKNAGTRTITVSDVAIDDGNNGNNYAVTYQNGTGTITPKALTATFADISRTYDGTTNATAGAGTLAGVETIDEGEVSVSGVAAYDTKNVGTGKTVNYTDVTLTGEEKDNYTIADNATGSGEITKANVTFTVEDYSRGYDGTDSTTGATLKTVGTIYGSDTVSGGTFTLDSRNAGTRTLSVSGVAIDDGNGGNNYAVTYQDGTGTITAAPLTVSTDAVTKAYDGTTSATGAARVASGTLYGTDAISGGTFAFADKNAGTGKAIAVSNVTISDGNGGNNYNVTYQSGTGTITAAPLTISTDAVTKEYDGTTSAAGAAAKVASGQLYGADAISGGTFAFADKNAGTGKAITVSGVTINDGNGGNNYNVTYQSGTGTITRKALELVADAKTITEGEARPAFTGRVTGFVEGEGLESASDLAFAPANPAAAAAGIYKVTGRLKGAASGDYGMNYTFANAAANDTAFTIEARSILPQEIISGQIDASGAAQEYTGTVTALESTARAENQAALPQQEKFAGGTTANYVSHLTIENGGTNTPPNMDVAAAMSGEKAEQTAASSAGTKAAPAAKAIADRATADEEE